MTRCLGSQPWFCAHSLVLRPVYLYFLYFHTYRYLLFWTRVRRKDVSRFLLSLFFFPPLGTHAHVSVALCLPFRTAALARYPLVSSMLRYTPHAPMHTRQRSHKSPSLDHLPLPNAHTHTHVIAALVPPTLPCCAWANSTIHSCFHTFPLYNPPLLQFSVTTAVCQLSACPSLVRDEAETQRVYREDSLASLSLPPVFPTSDFHFSWGFLPYPASPLEFFLKHVLRVKYAQGIQQ